MMAKSTTKEKKNTTGLDQNTIRRAAKARRKNTPKKAAVPHFSIYETYKERKELERQRRENERAEREYIKEKKNMGYFINECIDAVFAGADRTGLCFLFRNEKPQYQATMVTDANGNSVPDYVYDENGDMIPLPVKYSNAVRYQAQQEIIDWCNKNPGKYECRMDKEQTLALANLFVKKG